MTIPVTEKVKYLSVSINSKTNSTDPSMALRNFFGSFNNIMSVLGTPKDEMLAVHLVKTYCFPVLLYGSKTWSPSLSFSDKYTLNVAYSNCSAEFLMVPGEKAQSLFCFIVRLCL